MKRDGYVLLPQPIQQEAVRLLEESELKVMAAPEANPESVAPLMRDACAVVLRTGIRMTAELINRSGDLLTISRTGAGFDNVDVKAATEKGVIVTSSIGVNTSSVAEHCLTILLCLFKQLFLLDREVRNGNFQIRYKNYPHDLEGKTLGIIGFGRIGSLLAEKCHRLFSMKVAAYDPFLNDNQKAGYEGWVEFVDLEKVFAVSDAISVHIPLNENTRGLINNKYFRLMKPESFLINTARGGVVDEKDLCAALENGVIAGAGLDVFEKEPVDKNNPLLKMKNVIVTPHTAALTMECVMNMAVSAAERVIDVLNGKKPPGIANPEVLSREKWSHLT